MKITKTVSPHGTEYQEDEHKEGNGIILEDGVVKMINEHVLDSHGNII